MEEPSSLSAILDAVAVVARAVWGINWSWYLSWLVHIVALPLRLLWILLSFIASFLLVLLAPALYVVSYFLSWMNAIVAFVVGLEPLYTFFGAAAGVGIVAGIALGVTSSLITSYLGMQGDPQEDERQSAKMEKYDLGTSKASPAIIETDWYLADSSPTRQRRPSGLLSQTIHEEDDDSDL
ncbi:hypothetical protein TOPH_01738 [Tolypocladium ophioglossoides CBS 100239]|uniref:Transmembrane protein n=1 Tax=Tolypocladium ophioglossoides (strain CBS 100239) TaxID=1163406 RepID=A0A0L0NHY7_TOLOC|nr:hypothetical protein TOPH_01738 [Tolypocladium ophioglossoides CBS 100239]